LLELVAVEAHEDGLNVVDELVDPGQVKERAVDGDEDDAELLAEGPSEAVLVVLVRGVHGGGSAILCASNRGLFLDEDVRDKRVDDGRVDGGVGPGPQHHSGSADDFKGVQHGGYRSRGGG